MKLPKWIIALRDRGALFIVNHSGGKDSQAMTIELRRAGIPVDQIMVAHAELPLVDWEGIPEHIEATIPPEWKENLRYCKAGKTFFDMVEHRFATRPSVPCWPSSGTRQCTSDLKRDQIAKAVRHFVKVSGHTLIVHCMGIRAEESAAREKKAPFTYNRRECTKKRRVWTWYPIFRQLETEVRATVAEEGQKLHWAYAEGMSRLSCCFCIMASRGDIKTAARLKPDLLARYIELEDRTGYTMRTKTSLRELLADESIELPAVACDCA